MIDGTSRSEIARQAGDRLIVTVLFADVVSSTQLTARLDPDDIRDLLDQATGIMASAVRAYDGAVVRFQGDGIEAVFGTPRPAEDHAVRACLAGLAIQDAFRQSAAPKQGTGAGLDARLKVRVGIHSGLVIARELNSDLGGGVDLLGATVSLAALAEKICPPGAVTATLATADLAAPFLKSRPHLPAGHALADQFEFVEVLGVDLAARNIRAACDAASDLFVGRIDEQQTILKGLDRALQSGSIIGLLGDPGIGKSRLCVEIARSAGARQIPVYQIQGLSLMHATPYAPVPAFLRALLGLEAGADAEAAARLAHDLALGKSHTVCLLELLGLESGAAADRAAGAAEHRKRLLDAFCAIVLKAWGKRPALLVVDDLQLLDAETVACLRRLARQIGESRALMLVNGRPQSRQAIGRMTQTVIDLQPLAKSDVLELITSLAPDIAGDGEIAGRVAERSGGVPFVLEQILKVMTRQGGASFDDRILPTNVESMVLARLNAMSAEAKQFAQLASILREESDYRLLVQVAGGSLADPDGCVRELVHGGFLKPVAADTVRFKHSLIRDACLDSIVRQERQRLHARALACLKERYASLPPYFEQIAHHAEGAGYDQLALEYLWSAAKNAARNSAVQSLEVLFERAMACCERLGSEGQKREVDFVLLAFDALQQHGSLMNVVPRLARTAELAQIQGRKDKECLARAHLATVLWFQARHQEGRKLAENAVALAGDIRALPAMVYTQLTLANLRHGCGDIPGAIELLQSNVDLLAGELELANLGAVGTPSVMSRSFLGWYLIDQGRFDEAGRNIRRAIEVADAQKRPYSRVLAHLAHGRLSYELGNYEAAVQALSPVRDWCWRHRIHAMEPSVTGVLASALCRTGAPRAALAATEASISKQFFRGAARMACFYLFTGHGEALSMCGEAARGRDVIAKAVEQTQAPCDPCLNVAGRLLLGRIFRLSGEIGRARTEFEGALPMAIETGMVPCAARAHEGLAQCSRESSALEFRRHADAATLLYRQCNLAAPASLEQ